MFKKALGSDKERKQEGSLKKETELSTSSLTSELLDKQVIEDQIES